MTPRRFLVFVSLSLAISVAPVRAATFTVNSTADAPDADLVGGGAGICATAADECTLRAAIQESNASIGVRDTIAFNIPGAGPHTIVVGATTATALPTITDPVDIDGFTQPGSSANTNPVADGIDAVLQIELTRATGVVGDGLSISAGDSTVRGLVINGGFSNGIFITTNGGNSVEGCFIGTNVAGTAAAGNSQGMFIDSADNTVGGTSAAARNLISGQTEDDGIEIFGAGATGNVVQGNFIGTDVTGTVALGNHFNGVAISMATMNTVGGTAAGATNLISGNEQRGVALNTANANLVQGNLIGTDAAGSAAVPNVLHGIELMAAENNTIGGATADAGNVISGNLADGVLLVGVSRNNLIANNFVGTSAAGDAAVGNGRDGIEIEDSPDNTADANVISGNSANGVFVRRVGAAGSVITNNLIGTDATGTAPLPNAFDGVLVTLGAIDSDVGPGNTIAFNGRNGVRVARQDGEDPSGIAILGNSIFANTLLGIDLGGECPTATSDCPPDGVTANDAGDTDTGPNGLQNFPVLASAVGAGGMTTVMGSLNSTANTTFRVELFANTACDGSGFGEGEVFLGSGDRTTDAGGNVDFTIALPVAIGNGVAITATATDPDGNTSEFSQCVTASSTDTTSTSTSTSTTTTSTTEATTTTTSTTEASTTTTSTTEATTTTTTTTEATTSTTSTTEATTSTTSTTGATTSTTSTTGTTTSTTSTTEATTSTTSTTGATTSTTSTTEASTTTTNTTTSSTSTTTPADCSAFACGSGGRRQSVCHVPPGNPARAKTICINSAAVPEHLDHGDRCGPCNGARSARSILTHKRRR